MTETDTPAVPAPTDSAAPAAPAPAPAPAQAALVPAIELTGVVKEFHSGAEVVQAVRGVDLSIRPGEFFSMLGPSGCGKTTTMRMIAGFEEPTKGTVRLHGSDVTNVPPHKRDVNMVFQSYALFPHMSVFDNVAFGLRRKKVPGSEITSRVTEMLEIVDLSTQLKRKPRELSGGQQQRVALARALVNHPSALLLDEPLGALDLKLRQAMQVELKRIQREVGITFVYVTHDQGEALTMSDRIAVMNDGLIEQLGPPREIYEHPATRFVAGFIGTSNLLTGTVKTITDGRAVVATKADERIIVPARDDTKANDEIEITVRPEKIRLSSTQPQQGDTCAVTGTVTEVVYLGTSTNYNITTSSGAEVVVFSQNAASSDNAVERGSSVWLSWDPEHSYAIGSTK
jgi:spermidine/putrescine transport system ATP-binding protein